MCICDKRTTSSWELSMKTEPGTTESVVIRISWECCDQNIGSLWSTMKETLTVYIVFCCLIKYNLKEEGAGYFFLKNYKPENIERTSEHVGASHIHIASPNPFDPTRFLIIKLTALTLTIITSTLLQRRTLMRSRAIFMKITVESRLKQHIICKLTFFGDLKIISPYYVAK